MHNQETSASQCSTTEDSAGRAVPRPGSDPRENCLEKIYHPRVGRRSTYAFPTLNARLTSLVAPLRIARKPHFMACHQRLLLLLISKVCPRLWMQHMQAFSQPLVAFHQLAWRHRWLVWAPRAIIPSTIPVQQKVGVVRRLPPRSRASPHPRHVSASCTPISQSSMCRINEAGK